MRSLLVAAALALAVVPSTAHADASSAPVAAAPEGHVHYHRLSRMLKRFRLQAEARALERVLAQR